MNVTQRELAKVNAKIQRLTTQLETAHMRREALLKTQPPRYTPASNLTQRIALDIHQPSPFTLPTTLEVPR